LTINNASGVTLSATRTLNGTLTLTSGRLITGANQINLGNAATTAGASTNSYVDGNLQKAWTSTGTKSFTFPIGAGTNYASCGVTNLVVTTTGSLLAATSTGEHANIATSTVNPAKDANRRWTLTAVGGLVASSHTAICTPTNADLDG
jgi:hypothetical protein